MLISLQTMLVLAGCSSIKPLGEVGPAKLGVYAIAQSDFLAATRMIVILDKKGNVVASTGGTVAGGGTVGVETAGSIATAGAIVYGAKAIQHGLQNASVKMRGVPDKVDIDIGIKRR
jgi:uncharacterized protein YceK